MKVFVISLLSFGMASAMMSCDCGKSYTISDGMVGRKRDPADEYPWMVGFQKEEKDTPFCGGAIITPRHVISAAHCFEGITADDIFIIAGSTGVEQNVPSHHIKDHKSEKSSRVYTVKEIIIHPKYDNSKRKLNDISVVVTSEEMKYNRFVGPVCMLTGEMGKEMKGASVRVLEWERYASGPKGRDAVSGLVQVDLKIVPHKECRSRDAPLFCTKPSEEDSCIGESGGPVAWMDHNEKRFSLVGVVSYGFSPCRDTKSPTVNTDVSGHLTWINKQIKRLKGDWETCHKVGKSPLLTSEN